MHGNASPDGKPGANEGPALDGGNRGRGQSLGHCRALEHRAADPLLDEFEEKIRLLARFPETGRRREELGLSLRSLATSGFVILYQIYAEVLEIVRVVHGSRDLEGLLSEEETDASGDSP